MSHVIVTVAQFVFLFLVRARRQNRQYYCIKTQIDNNFSWSVLLSLIEMKSNFAVKALACSSWFNLSFEHICGSSPTESSQKDMH